MSGPDLIRLVFLITALVGVIGGFSVAYNKRYLLIALLVVYETVVVFLSLRSDQSVPFALIEQALLFSFFYVLASSLAPLRKPMKAAVLAVIFPAFLVLIKPLRIYFFCQILFLCT
ncbi:MAG TPA: hypothetical protein VF275_10120 [Gammaproteobacteria bacterium]